MRNVGIQLKIVAVSLLAAAVTSVVLGAGFLVLIARDTEQFTRVALEESRTGVGTEMRARAASVAARATDLAVPALARRDRAGLATSLRPLLDDPTVAALVVRDSAGRTMFEWMRPRSDQDANASVTAVAKIRDATLPLPGTQTPATIGEAQVAVIPATRNVLSAATLRRQLLQVANVQLGRALLMLLALGLIAGAAAAVMASWLGRRVRRPIETLVRSAERFTQGDYSRPLEVHSGDELAELEGALERMRQKLRSSTISKNYLSSVLGSMADAVFVTSPDGVIRMVNEAACKLLAYGEEELVGRSISSVLDESERASFDLLQAAQDTRESLVRSRQGQTIPVSLTGSQITSEDPQFQGIIFVVRNITERKRAERRIRYLARYDALTKVPNRMQFQHLLQQAIARGLRANTGVAMLYVDLDRFKEINDTFGHAAGDRTLEVLSERLTRSVPKEAVVGRLAGDEFAVFIDGLPNDMDNRGPISQLARGVLSEISKIFQLNNQEVVLTASIGIAFCPQDAGNVIDLIRNADAAMYYSKQNGGNTFALYVPEMNAAAVERLMLKSKLRRAMERNELELRYEPKIDLRTGKIIGAEALLRWRLPGYGAIPPSQFIPLAEESNLILELGEWVFNQACADYRSLRETVRAPGRIAVNLSLKQLRQLNFVQRMQAILRRNAVPPSAFELEITETTLMFDSKRTLHLLGELYAMGMHLAIDDFGTGYSSLSALQQFPIGSLKIDQSFVSRVVEDESDSTIVRTIIEMGRNLGMNVIAEGVESARHLEFLAQYKCQVAQGRLFGEPCSVAELRALLMRQESGTAPFAALIPELREPAQRLGGG